MTPEQIEPLISPEFFSLERRMIISLICGQDFILGVASGKTRMVNEAMRIIRVLNPDVRLIINGTEIPT